MLIAARQSWCNGEARHVLVLAFAMLSAQALFAELRAQPLADATAVGAEERAGSPATAPEADDLPALGDLGGLRPWLSAHGMTLDAFLLADLSRNFQGGLSTGRDAVRHLFEIGLAVDTEALFGHPGGTLFVDFQTQHRRHGTDLLVGDFQGFSNLDAPSFAALYELWYEQRFAAGELRLKVGKIDATNEFAFVENGSHLIHSSAGFSSTILGFTTYPNPATGAVLFAAPADWVYVGGGLFDGATQAGVATGTRGPSTLFGDPSDLFLVAEVGNRRMRPDGRVRRVARGVSHHTGTFDLVDGSGGREEGATSAYLVLDQRLANRRGRVATLDVTAETAGIDGFLQLGSTSGRIAEADRHAGAGLMWSGYVPGRKRDQFGLMAGWVQFSAAARSARTHSEPHELALELFYRLHLTPWLVLQPDLQFIANPGGAGLDDALVGTLRLTLPL